MEEPSVPRQLLSPVEDNRDETKQLAREDIASHEYWELKSQITVLSAG